MKHGDEHVHSQTHREAMRIERLEPDRRCEVLSAYLDDELAPAAARHVTAWLDAHPEMLKEVEHNRRTWDLLDLYADEPVAEDFAARVLAQTLTPRRPFLLRPQVAAAAAAVLVLTVGGLLFATRSSDPTPVETRDVAGLSALEGVPAEYLEQADALLALSDDEFEALLMADLEEPWKADLEEPWKDG